MRLYLYIMMRITAIYKNHNRNDVVPQQECEWCENVISEICGISGERNIAKISDFKCITYYIFVAFGGGKF